jgi:uncharacterized protein
MMVGEPAPGPEEVAEPASEVARMTAPGAAPAATDEPLGDSLAPAPLATAPLATADAEEGTGEEPAAGAGRLMAPEVEAAAAAAAAAAVGGLVRRLAVERGALVHRGGPTIEELVREEIRPLLKTWLDANLPGLVERLVRSEVERVLGRIAP